MRALVLPLLCLFATALPGQRGDRQGEAQPLLPADLVVPPAPVLDPAAALAAFRLQPGFRIEAVATEPLVGDPVAAVFDARGRLWVVEMRGYMRDLDASGEREPCGRIAVLEDADGDGRFDRATPFLDGLVLPRAVLPLRGGALVVEPPRLWWCPDADGDGRADGKQEVMGGFEAGLDNPEHSGNGLLWGLDHRIHLANDKRLLRWTPAGFAVEMGAGGGQWGISHDDRGRCYFNYNEDWLRCDLVPGRLAAALRPGEALPGLNHRLLRDTSVWPIRITPGVNRGYQPGRLVDHVLAIHTAVCGPHVYRGAALPCDGEVFVCEPAGHVVRRIALADGDAAMHGANVYQAARQEFLASTDERFRPVNLLTGPDGALYVVDMYRGVIQHRNFVTTFLRRQIEARGLERPTGLGRIWRITAAAAPFGGWPAPLHDAPAAALVAALGEANGARRDTALRELVQRQDAAAVPALRQALRAAARPAVRIALLSALQGLGGCGSDELRFALVDADPGVVAFALQLAAEAGAPLPAPLLRRLAETGPPTVAWHLALYAAARWRAGPPAAPPPLAVELLLALAARAADDPILAGLVAAAPGAGAPVLLAALAAAAASPGGPRVLRELARGMVRGRDPAQAEALFAAAAAAPAPLRLALLQGAVQGLPKGAARQSWWTFAATPPALAGLAGAAGGAGAAAAELLAAVALRGAPAAPPAELSAEERRRVAAGQRLYGAACAACHQLDGSGMAGLAPPLRGSEWTAGPPARLLRIALHGLRGPVEVDGTTWNLEMPGQRHLGDDDLAAVLSYVRQAFGGGAAPIAPAAVQAERAASGARSEPWTAAELLREQ